MTIIPCLMTDARIFANKKRALTVKTCLQNASLSVGMERSKGLKIVMTETPKKMTAALLIAK